MSFITRAGEKNFDGFGCIYLFVNDLDEIRKKIRDCPNFNTILDHCLYDCIYSLHLCYVKSLWAPLVKPVRSLGKRICLVIAFSPVLAAAATSSAENSDAGPFIAPQKMPDSAITAVAPSKQTENVVNVSADRP